MDPSIEQSGAVPVAASTPRQYLATLDEQGRSTVVRAGGEARTTAGGALSVRDLWRLAPEPEPSIMPPSPPAQSDTLDVDLVPGASRAIVSTFLRAYDSGLHRTSTVDLSTVVSGSVSFHTETAVVMLRTGDSVVVPGVLHRWHAAEAACVLLVVMIGTASSKGLEFPAVPSHSGETAGSSS